MTRRLVTAMTGLVAVVSILLAIPIGIVVAANERNALIAQLQVDTLASASVLGAQPVDAWPRLVQDIASVSGARVVIVDASSGLLADSDGATPGAMFDRPEIVAALRGDLSSNVRASRTLGEDLRFVAAPVLRDGAIVAAVRLSLPETRVAAAVRETLLWLAAFVVALLVLSAIVAVLVARSIARPIRALAAVARVLPSDLQVRADESTGPPEVRDAAHALNRTAGILDGILQRTQAVSAEASHHLRTPLTGVRLRLEAIEDLADDAHARAQGSAGKDAVVEPISDIRRQASAATAEVDRLTHRIDQVLALARSDARMAHQADPVLTRASVMAIVRARAEVAQALLAVEGITLEVTPDSTAARMRSQDVGERRDVGDLPRIVDELLANAGAYAACQVRVEVAGEPGRPTMARISVGDDGPGVPTAEHARIFERFARGSTAIPGGSGLGLALVREAARRVGGDAVAGRDPVLRGLRIDVLWPVVEEEEESVDGSG